MRYLFLFTVLKCSHFSYLGFRPHPPTTVVLEASLGIGLPLDHPLIPIVFFT